VGSLVVQTDRDRQQRGPATRCTWVVDVVLGANYVSQQPLLEEDPVLSAGNDVGSATHPRVERRQPGTRPGWQALLVAALVYLGASLLVWWNVWTSHPTSTTICGCGDPSLFTWFLAWPAHAILHGQNPLYSTALFHPGGVNLLSNTSEPAIGTLLAPVTWLFGPVATLNVALILCPVLSAIGMYVLLRRWVAWSPAAIIGGFAYGFAPFMLLNLTNAWFMVCLGVVPPLIVLCLDELLLRQGRPPITTGVLLGLLVALQFFIGTEVLLIVVISAAIGVGLLVVSAAIWRPGELRSHFRIAATGLGAGAATAVVLLAYPLWFALAGPAHLGGTIWPQLRLQYAGVAIKDLFVPAPPNINAFGGYVLNHRIGGYQGTVLSPEYIGLGVIAVMVGGLIAFRRDRKIWFFGGMVVISLMLAVGARKGYPLPWTYLTHLPQFENIIPARFLVVTWLAIAIVVALIVDHTYGAVGRWRRTTAGNTPKNAAALAAGLVAVVAIAPQTFYLAGTTPFTTQTVVLPTWFRTQAPHLPPHQVLLVIPAPSGLRESAATWQAVEGMSYSMVEGPGPGGVPSRAAAEAAGAAELGGLSYFNPKTTTFDAVPIQRAVRGWGVTTIVIPDQADLPSYMQVPSVTLAVALMTAATGRRPSFQSDAWVWYGADRMLPAKIASPPSIKSCTNGLRTRGAPAVSSATTCVLRLQQSANRA